MRHLLHQRRTVFLGQRGQDALDVLAVERAEQRAHFGLERATAADAATETATFAAGCFWCVEKDFEALPGVISAESGYTAGRTPNPTYQSVSAGLTDHTEAVRIVYDPARVSYTKLLDHFWRNVDPTARNRQFCDIGSHYRSGIYWQNDAERQTVEAIRDALLKSGRFSTIHTELAAVSPFYLAEDYHQDYYKKNELRYNYYRLSCGRDARVKKLWE
jgi:peptide-methionine (S)-S-oxide reductase